MLRIIRRMWQVTWAEQWQYRANLLMYLFYWIVSPIIYLAVWTTIAASQGSVKGLTANDFVLYYLLVLIVDQFTSDITIHILAYKIQDGTLANELLKPVHPILTQIFVNGQAHKTLNFIVLIPIWGLLALIYRPEFSAAAGWNMLFVLPALILGMLISFLFGATITCLAFWTTRVYSLSEFFFAFSLLFSGQFVPLVLMPDWIQRIAQFLPYRFFIYFPIQIVLGQVTVSEILYGLLAGVGWLVIMFGLFTMVWRAGVRRFSAVGA
jgi:ABC-2 type transport system permease protein